MEECFLKSTLLQKDNTLSYYSIKNVYCNQKVTPPKDSEDSKKVYFFV